MGIVIKRFARWRVQATAAVATMTALTTAANVRWPYSIIAAESSGGIS